MPPRTLHKDASAVPRDSRRLPDAASSAVLRVVDKVEVTPSLSGSDAANDTALRWRGDGPAPCEPWASEIFESVKYPSTVVN